MGSSKPVTDGAQKALADMTSRFDTLVKEAEGLKERVKALELQPANAGPRSKAVKSTENPHMENTRQDAVKAKLDVIEKQLASTTNLQEMMRLSRDKALLEIPGMDDMVSVQG